MFLIMSGAYIGQELESEFGKIPPSFLPLGNRRLFQHQVKSAPEGVNVFISVPESYQISTRDKKWLNAHSVTIIPTADDLILGASLVAALNISDQSLDSPLHVLFGDTLIQTLPNGDDIIGISEVNNSYNWAVITNSDLNWLSNREQKINLCSNDVVNGYFKFSQPRQLIKAITQNHWEFIGGLNSYHNAIGLTPVKVNDWLDFGHVNTYYHSKVAFTTQRSFNELIITKDWIEKSSYKNQKIRAEANWFTELPPKMRIYTPQFLGVTNNEKRFSYRLEYLHCTALNELFVFALLPTMIWTKILNNCTDFIVQCRDYNAPQNVEYNSLDELFRVKTEQRLSEYCQSQGIRFDQYWIFNENEPTTLIELMASSKKHLPVTNIPVSLLHGDFCFSNILYDFRANRVKTIDPRGLTTDEQLTIYGDTRYDLAKLSHSVLGLYDWIIAGYYDVKIENNKITFSLDGIKQHKDTQQSFIEIIESKFGLTALNLYAMQIQLFLSMLPLHSDDLLRQQALFANAFRLYGIIKRLEQ
ncbi:capsular biosynthesis protein [Psychromonas sp. RZ22]|uniref:capsular biosynthesis protein n=1 Tax=Psychromonas algarum TaxID=2555643 RepID=UPI0010682103|nr:capsular biosynthesis protein [Psychromonas sp. RZ22]TEW55755.1 capsular biosynthesis protein [Psychromonas sp. RZ22]